MGKPTDTPIRQNKTEKSLTKPKDRTPYSIVKGVWALMLQRCHNQDNKSYPNYGGRGIKVCARWQKFENFLEDIGERPSDDHSLDRVNNDGDYEPSNCRWATKREQSVNRRTTRWVTIEGVSKPLHDWVNEFGITNTGNLYRDMRKGMSEVEALLHNKRKVELKGSANNQVQGRSRKGMSREDQTRVDQLLERL